MNGKPVYYEQHDGGERAYTVTASNLKFGAGALAELGGDAKALGLTRVALFVDPAVTATAPGALALESLRQAGIDVAVFDAIRVEPTDGSLMDAAAFARGGNFDGYVSLGGGSAMDTAKAANLFATYPDELLAYVNAPIGQAKPIPGPVKPHIACPTTCGTGSETTGVVIFDLVGQKVKTGISSKYLKPTLAVVDPETTLSLPPGVVAATGFDVLTHAIESYTARPFTSRAAPADPTLRPPYQGANPYSDIGSLEAIRLGGANLVRAVTDPGDREARFNLMFGATLAGLAFGNAGVHIPHAMSYSVAGLRHDFHAQGYDKDGGMVPHGISVVLNAPAAFRFTSEMAPDRHLKAAEALGASLADASHNDAGALLGDTLGAMIKACGLPNGLSAVGYMKADIPDLVAGASRQQRLLVQAPRPVSDADLAALYEAAMTIW